MCDRREDLLTTMHGPRADPSHPAAVRNDGRMLGVRVEIRASNGAYAMWPFTAGLDSGQASENVTGPYDIAAYERDVYAVVTNKAPMGPYRGVGRIAACFAIERTIDEIALRLGLEPLEVRRRNVIRSYPYRTIAGLTFESGSSAEAIEVAERMLDLPKLRREHADLRKRGIYRGVGFAAIVEHSALGPLYFESRGGDKSLSYETATVRAEPDGQVTLIVGTHSHGQGHETTFAQVAADELGLPVDQVMVRFGDTAVAPYGLGTWASRSLVYAGGATILACGEVKRKAIQIAAHMMEQPTDDARLCGRGSGAAGRSRPADELRRDRLASPTTRRKSCPRTIDPGLEATRRYRAPDPGSFSNSLHAAVVEVDIRTGAVAILRYLVVEDCGRVVNPLIVDGQVIGGVAQGIGQAFLEEAHYDENGPAHRDDARGLSPPGVRYPAH